MLSSWYDDWKDGLGILWKALIANILGYYKYTFWWNSDQRAHYADLWRKNIIAIADHIISLVEHYANEAVEDFEDWVKGLLGIKEKPSKSVYSHITDLWDSVVAIWATFGPEILTNGTTVVKWVNGRITSVNNSIIAIWAKFGPAFLEGDWTVVSWVEDKVTAVVQWVLDNYAVGEPKGTEALNWINSTGKAAVNWIATKGGVTAGWVRDYGQSTQDWLNGYSGYYMSIYNKYRGTLSSFLRDPKAFIEGYIEDYLKGTTEEPGPSWWSKLLAFLLDPIRWLWAYLEAAWDIPYAWAMNWLIENTPTPEADEADLRETDELIPTIDEWIEGLFEPVTEEEIAFDAQLSAWAEQIVDETLVEHPFQLPEIA